MKGEWAIRIEINFFFKKKKIIKEEKEKEEKKKTKKDKNGRVQFLCIC